MSDSRGPQIIFCPSRFASLSGPGRPVSSGSCELDPASELCLVSLSSSCRMKPTKLSLVFPSSGSCFSHCALSAYFSLCLQNCFCICLLIHHLRNKNINISLYNIEIVILCISITFIVSNSWCVFISFGIQDNPEVGSAKE